MVVNYWHRPFQEEDGVLAVLHCTVASDVGTVLAVGTAAVGMVVAASNWAEVVLADAWG